MKFFGVSILARRVTGDFRIRQRKLRRIVSIHARRVTGDYGIDTFEDFKIVSIHARRVTGDRIDSRRNGKRTSFNSRPSCDGRQRRFPEVLCCRVSIHARRVTGDHWEPIIEVVGQVSIHARRVTGDWHLWRYNRYGMVSIHARRVTGDESSDTWQQLAQFQFTPVV